MFDIIRLQSMGGMGRVRSRSSQLTVAREPLASRALPILEEHLEKGTWGDMLPSERKLAETLQISRMTLRTALAQLERRGWISSGQGRRRRILHGGDGEARRKKVLVVLTPVPIEAMEPHLMLLLHHLSEGLLKKGLHVEIEARPSCFSRRPERALAALARELRPAGWLLFRGNRAAQEWFRRSGLAFVIVGSTFVDKSPSFGSEHTAIGVHAGAQFLRFGHRHGAMIAPRHETEALTDVELAQGLEAAGFSCRTVFHDRTRKGILHALDSALALRPRVTALFTLGGQYGVTLLCGLLNRGIAVPGQISLIAKGDDPAFPYLVPSPARYEFTGERAARLLFRLVCRVVIEGDRSRSAIELLPEFLPGESLGKAPQKMDD